MGTKANELHKFNWGAFLGKYAIYFIFLAMFLISALISDSFLNFANLVNVLRQMSVVTIIACGETMVIIAGMTDLAPGAILAISGCVGIGVSIRTGSPLLGLLVGIAIGVAAGIVSGIAVSQFRVPPFIATLAVMNICRGAAYVYTDGKTIYNIGSFAWFGQGSILSVPAPIVFMILVILLSFIILNRTKFGRYLYAVGGNEEAAIASGINTKRIKLKAYMIECGLAGLGGVILCSRLNSGIPSAGMSYEFDAIIAAIIGGTSFSGGIGTISGTIVGSAIIALLNNMLNLLSVQSYWQSIVKGIVIMIAVIIDMSRKPAK
ncbi:ABC transporter permease [Anaerolentibacter hominis]|uniref:ABC transporter permease n=1 Tax=Anaerolentibacter hominis TaxID=3079009 RepID=UPI0031B849EF